MVSEGMSMLLLLLPTIAAIAYCTCRHWLGRLSWQSQQMDPRGGKLSAVFEGVPAFPAAVS